MSMKNNNEAAHSPRYEDVKKYYDAGVWGYTAVRNAVKKGWITPLEYKDITDEDYE